MKFAPLEILGKPIVEVSTEVLPHCFDNPPKNEIIEDRIYSSFVEEGVGLVADLGGAVVGIQLYRDGFQDFGQFAGETPHGISFEDGPDSLRAKLGEPEASSGQVGAGHGGWLRFYIDGTYIHVRFDDQNGTVDLITLSKDHP